MPFFLFWTALPVVLWRLALLLCVLGAVFYYCWRKAGSND
jgi:hypothetical protein